jgi:hypothetical protein
MDTQRPGTHDYDTERTGFQLLHPHHPDLVVSAHTTGDIHDALDHAITHRQPIAVHTSGHGHNQPLEGGILINTSRLTDVHIDPETRTAHIAAGATWQHVIDAAAPHGLAPRSGSSPGVGAISYTLGGGIGLLARPHGHAADHVPAIDVTTPDGQHHHATPTIDTDLYWALRGGGGNYGIVTAITVDLVPLRTIHGGGLYFDTTEHPDILHTWHHWTTDLPDTMTSATSTLAYPDLPMIPAELRGKHITQLQLASTAPADDLVAPLRAIGPVRDTLRELPYTESATVFDEPNQPHAYRSTNILVDDLDPASLTALTQLTRPGAPIMTVANLRHLGAALTVPPATPNAVAHRDAAYSLTILSVVDGDQEAKIQALHRDALDAWAPHTLGASPNFTYGPLDPALAYPAATRTRLTDIAHEHDPHRLLHTNHPLD